MLLMIEVTADEVFATILVVVAVILVLFALIGVVFTVFSKNKGPEFEVFSKIQKRYFFSRFLLIS